MSQEILAKNTAGLGLIHLQTIMAEATKNRLPFTNEELIQKKKEMIEFEAGGLLELWRPSTDWTMWPGHPGQEAPHGCLSGLESRSL